MEHVCTLLLDMHYIDPSSFLPHLSVQSVCVHWYFFLSLTLAHCHFQVRRRHHESPASGKLECLKPSDPYVCALNSPPHTHTHTDCHDDIFVRQTQTFKRQDSAVTGAQFIPPNFVRFPVKSTRVCALPLLNVKREGRKVEPAVIYKRRVEDPTDRDSRRGKNNNNRGTGSYSVSMRHLRRLRKKKKKETYLVTMDTRRFEQANELRPVWFTL